MRAHMLPQTMAVCCRCFVRHAALIALLPMAVHADPALSVAPASLPVDASADVVLTIDGLASGDTVLLERYLDVNGNSLIDPGDLLVQSALVRDGHVILVDGQRDFSQPGDEDNGAVDGRIVTHFNLATSPELARIVGPYLIRVSSPTAAFTPILKMFTLNPSADSRIVAGRITTVSSTAISHALVCLLQKNGTSYDFLRGAIADSNGNYTLRAPAGTYLLLPMAPGYVANLTTATPLTLSTSDVTRDLTLLTGGSRIISGQVQNRDDYTISLPGVQLFLLSQDGLAALTTTDTAGNFSVGVTAGLWEIQASSASLAALGYLNPNDSPAANAGNFSVTSFIVPCVPAATLIHGTITDRSGGALPRIHLTAQDDANRFNPDAVTDAQGRYSIGASTGNWALEPTATGLILAARNLTVNGPTAADFQATVVTRQPTDVAVYANQSATFEVADGAPGIVTGQWQVSTDGGDQWTAIPALAPYTGTADRTLSIAPATLALSGNRYRCTITYNDGANTEISDVAILTVSKRSQTIAVSAQPDVVWSTAPIVLGASATSALPVAFSVVSGPAQLTGNTLTLTGVGLVTVRASQTGDASYAAAPSVDFSFQVRSSFLLWQRNNFTADELADANLSGPRAVHGSNGLANLVCYALGLTTGESATGHLPTISFTATDAVYTYTRPSDRTDIAYTVEVSTDLKTWGTTGVTHELVATSNGEETWRARYARAGAARVFFHLKIIQ